jgi:4-aminobutyrate aminotransferase-like enzyme
MNAIELVSDLKSHEPAAELTAEIVKVALSKGLVLVTAGPARNVIRILVALSVSTEIIEEGMSILEAAINETLNQVS